MRVFKVYNGYMSNDAVHVIVLAADEKTAVKLAEAVFKEDAVAGGYGEKYSANLWAEQVCSPEHPTSGICG